MCDSRKSRSVWDDGSCEFSQDILRSVARTFALFAVAVSSLLKSRASLQLENIAFRHQIGVLQRSSRRRPKPVVADRFFWAWLCRVWSDWH